MNSPSFTFLRLAALFVLLVAGGCGSLPRVIVLQDPLSADEHFHLAYAYEQKGDREAAKQEYQAALKKDKHQVGALVNLGNLAAAENQIREAIGYYKKALRLRPDHAGANNNLASIYISQDRNLEEAGALIQRAMSADPDHLAYYLDSQALLLLRQGYWTAARWKSIEAESAAGSDEASFQRQHARTKRAISQSGISSGSPRSEGS